MKSGLLITAVLVSLVSINASWALDGKVFPGKGSKETWLSACRLANDGDALANAKKHDAAVAKYQQSIAMYPHADALYRDFGVTYEERGKPGDLQKAESAYRKACELDPKDWKNWNALAGNMGSQERYKECRDASVKAMSCKPPADKAVGIQKTIQSLNEYFSEQQSKIGYEIQAKGNYSGALDSLNKALLLDPQNADALHWRATCFQRLGKLEAANLDFNKAIQSVTNNPKKYDDAYRVLGGIYRDWGKYDRSIHYFELALKELQNRKTPPKDLLAFIYTDRGWTYFLDEQFEKAIDDFSQSIRIDSTYAQINYCNRGEAYYKLARFEFAMSDLNKAISMDKKDGSAFYYRGKTKQKIGDSKGAALDLSEAAKLGYIPRPGE